MQLFSLPTLFVAFVLALTIHKLFLNPRKTVSPLSDGFIPLVVRTDFE